MNQNLNFGEIRISMFCQNGTVINVNQDLILIFLNHTL